ncbi:MAG: SAM-dependent chlorinase/fluorinase [Prevotellaceae bacterium]|jgi:S-adenosylmethionine hydrolase|nr:SAM-dependent chlorinase/fluorinase [Prevotellaceae bacterium]
MPIVTLTSDWGHRDHYVAMLKGGLLSLGKDVSLVDISHDVKDFDVNEAAFMVREALPHFSEGSIHFIGVECVPTEDSPLVVGRLDGRYVIWVNNGFMSLIREEMELVAVNLNGEKFSILKHIPALIQRIVAGEELASLGKVVDLKKLVPKMPIIQENMIRGHIIHIDSHGNAITNISHECFDEVAKGREGMVFFSSNLYKSRVHSAYTDVPDGQPVAFFNSQSLLEVACCHGNAHKIYRLNKDTSSIMVKFEI